jgi:hypothetical protein
MHRRVRAEARARLHDDAMDTLLCGAARGDTRPRD